MVWVSHFNHTHTPSKHSEITQCTGTADICGHGTHNKEWERNTHMLLAKHKKHKWWRNPDRDSPCTPPMSLIKNTKCVLLFQKMFFFLCFCAFLYYHRLFTIHLSHTCLLHIYPQSRINDVLLLSSIVVSVLADYLSPDPFLLTSLSRATVFGKQPLSPNLYFQISQ